jgi:hypothetical protein
MEDMDAQNQEYSSQCEAEISLRQQKIEAVEN